MHKISWTLVVLIAITLNGLAQSDVSKSRWKSTAIIIDGNDKEWIHPLNFYDDKSGLLFAICNDQTNVYLAFTVNDEMKMRKLMSAGWSVELSSKEKNKKFSSSITFPAVKMMEMGNNRPGSQFEKKVAGNPFIDTYKSQLIAIAAKGFLSNRDVLSLNDHKGIDIAVGTGSEQRIFYEIAIPLKELMVENSFKLDELITLNVNVNALTRPSSGGDRGNRSNSDGDMQDREMSGMDGRQGGGMGGMGGGRGGMGGMGGMQGGGMQGGGMSRGGNGSADRSSLFEKVSFKQKFTLVGE